MGVTVVSPGQVTLISLRRVGCADARHVEQIGARRWLLLSPQIELNSLDRNIWFSVLCSRCIFH